MTAAGSPPPSEPSADAILADLARLVAVPSVGSLPQHSAAVRRSADLVASLFADSGCPSAEVVDDVAAPAVIARWPAPPGAPTVALYAHHDVQPVGEESLWRTAPFEAVVRGDRVFGRGTADDKGGIALHLATVRAFGGRPPVGLTIFVEGEEEIGSPHIGSFLSRHRESLEADVFVIADSGNWAVGEPAFTTSLRGICDCVVEVRTLEHAVHSGEFGGVAPDALTALSRLLATLHQPDGTVAVAGLEPRLSFDLDYPESRFRAAASLLPGVMALGRGSIADRLWAGPAISVIGLDAPSVAEASNTLIPVARALVSLRVPPGYDAVAARDRLMDHLTAHAPWGVHVTVTPGSAGQPAALPPEGPYAGAAAQAYGAVFGRPPLLIGQGGSIPLVNELAAAYPGATIIANAVSDPDSMMHAPNESVCLSDLVQSAKAQARFLSLLAP
ncbi:MAG: M20/M25/M40 family metallo-hydrolase [Propionibacteriaceae bacterium]|jgi:acetylornithine deacetylase/succinyl-diaminopimelate desuccinylase-like protein|nr:M20/M25/M40 family metallo-hydrolase [Propionibacteriaceae bacterium]